MVTIPFRARAAGFSEIRWNALPDDKKTETQRFAAPLSSYLKDVPSEKGCFFGAN